MRLTPKEIEEDYEYMWDVLEENFPLFEAAERVYGVKWEQVYAEYKEKCEQLSKGDVVDYYELLKECLAEFKNTGYLSVAESYIYNYVSSGDPWIVEQYYDKSKKTYAFLQQELERQLAQADKSVEKTQSMRGRGTEAIQVRHYNDIPIIEISSFSCPDEDEREAMVQKLTGILREEQDAKQIVFDLRGNGGGSSLIWENGIFPYLGKETIRMTMYSARINGDINQQMFPIDVDKTNTIPVNAVEYVVEPYDTSNGLPKQEMDGLEMNGIHVSDLERCDLFFKTEMKISPVLLDEQMGAEPDFRLKGDIVIFIDQYTASAATSMAQLFQNVGLATIVGTDVFCKHFLHKIAKSFCRSLHLHFVGNCKASCQAT